MPPARLEAAAALAALFLAARAPADQRRAPAAPSPAPPLRIEGVVKDPTGRPVEKALVMAHAVATPAANRTIHTRSDASGRFAMAVPRKGQYALRVEAPGLAPHALERLAVPAAPLTITLRKGASIAGVVRDARGKPVAGAQVEAFERRWGMMRPSVPLDPDAGRVRATTDAQGAFRLDGLGMVGHQVVASARGVGGARRDGIVPGTRVELFLTPGAAVRGLVRGLDRRPLAGAILSLDSDTPTLPRLLERTDESGSFQFWGVPAGPWRILASHPDAAPAVADLFLDRNAETAVELSLGPPARVRGRILDAEERPVPAARVALQELDGHPVAATLGGLLGAETDSLGRFVLEGLPRGPLALGITARGYAAARVEVSPAGADLDIGDVVLDRGLTIRGRVRDEAGQGIADAQVRAATMGRRPQPRLLETTTEADGGFVLGGAEQGVHLVTATAPGFAPRSLRVSAGAEPVDLVLPRAGSVTGTVVDEKGAAVPTFQVIATPVERDENWSPAFGDGADGRFHLEDLAPGEWSVDVSAPEKTDARVSPVKVQAGLATDAGRIRLRGGASVKGRVTDAAGSPIAGANVWAETPRRFAMVTRSFARGGFTDASGAFELRGVEPGRVDVAADHPEYAPGSASDVEVDPGRGAADVRITLTAGGRVEGVVRRRDGRPLERLRVQVSAMGPGFFGHAEVQGPDGTFSVDHVPPSAVRVTLLGAVAENTYTGLQEKRVEVSDGETAVVEFVLRDIFVSGTVTRRGEPLAGARVTLRGPTVGGMSGVRTGVIAAPPTGPQRGWAIARQDGTYELIVTEPGVHTASVASADGRLNYPARQVEVPDADAYSLDLAVGGSSVSGQTVDAETGAPLQAGVGALAAGGGRQAAYALAGTDGRFQLELEPGEYTLLARVPGYAPGKVALKVDESGAPAVRLALERGGTISGRVLDAAGRPAAAMMVVAFEEAEDGPPLPAPPRQLAQSEPDGRFTIQGLARGRHTLTAGDEVAGFGVLPGVAVGTSDAVLRLAPGGSVRALVVRADGAPAAGAFASVSRVDGRHFSAGGSGQTDSSGMVEIPAPAGQVEVTVVGAAGRGSASVAVTSGETAPVEIRLQPRQPGPGTR